jgi:AcrR family transcriptional regulator
MEAFMDEERRRERRRREVARVREEILRAFVRVAAHKGTARTTMEDVAAEAGYVAGSLYNYFPSRRALEAAVRDWLLGMFLDVLATPVPEGTPFPARFEFIVSRMFEVVEANREACMVFLTFPVEMGSGAEEGRRNLAMHEKFQAAFESLLAYGVAEGCIPAEKLKGYAMYFHALAHGILFMWALQGGGGSVREEFGDLVSFFLRAARE